MWPWMKNELMESSWLDGCTDMGIFLKMVLPIVKPALFTLSIIAFLQSWNSYLLPMIMINDPKMFTIPLVIASIGNMFVADYGARILAVVVGIIPIMIIFMIFSKQITEGLASGAVKGCDYDDFSRYLPAFGLCFPASSECLRD